MVVVKDAKDSAGMAYICGGGEDCEVGGTMVVGIRARDVAGTPNVGGLEVGGIGGEAALDVDMVSDTRLLRRRALLCKK